MTTNRLNDGLTNALWHLESVHHHHPHQDFYHRCQKTRVVPHLEDEEGGHHPFPLRQRPRLLELGDLVAPGGSWP